MATRYREELMDALDEYWGYDEKRFESVWYDVVGTQLADVDDSGDEGIFEGVPTSALSEMLDRLDTPADGRRYDVSMTAQEMSFVIDLVEHAVQHPWSNEQRHVAQMLLRKLNKL